MSAAAGSPPGAEEVREELERVLASADFDASPRSRDLLRFIVEETLAGRQGGLTQAAIATRVFGRREDFDPSIDPIVRIQAGRLRRSLERYYLLGGGLDPVRLELPRGAYVPVVRWMVRPEEAAGSGSVSPSGPVDDWPTVRVGVDRVGTEPGLEDAAARFLDLLAVELGRYRDVRVVLAREPEAAEASSRGETTFALSGHLSSDSDGLCVVTRLVDCRTASQAWAEEYRDASSRSRAFEEETARVVAAAVASEQGVVAKRLWAERRAQPPAALTPYGAILDSYQFFFNRDAADLAPAISALERAVAAEPECALAWVQLSRLYLANFAFDVSPLETPLEQALAFAQNGVRLDPTSHRGRVALAGSLLLEGELAAARNEAESALTLAPDSLVYLEWIGWVMTLAGEWERGPGLVRRALTRNPHVIPVAHHALWLDHLRRDEMELAHQAALQYRDPTFYLRAMMRACSLGHMGRREEASAEVAELLARKPDFARRGRALIGRLVKFPDLLERVADGLAKAGLVLD